MAADAFHVMVFTKKGIFGCLVVIEQYFFPPPIGVAIFTLRSKVAFMYVVLFMALVAQFWRVLEFVVNVASFAFHIKVLAEHREFGFAVVKVRCLPVLLLMAVLAFRPQRALVLVILCVATDARCRSLAIFFELGMAVLAEDFAG